MQLTGKVHEIGEKQQVSEKFAKRNLIIEYAENPSYPEYIQLEAHQDKTALLDLLLVGNEVEVDFNLRGKPWTDKTGKKSYFNSLVIWKLSVLKSETNASSTSKSPGEEDDLPF